MIKSKKISFLIVVTLVVIGYIGVARVIALNDQPNTSKKTTQEDINPSNDNKPSTLSESGISKEISDWFAARGNFDFSKKDNSYASMPDEKLKELSDQGNLRAFDALSTRYLSDPKYLNEEFKTYRDINWLAAVYGSTKALSNLAIIQDSLVMTKSPIEEDKKAGLIETMAYLNAQELRGDLMGKLVIAPMFEKQRGVILTEEDKTKIHRRAENIYAELQKKRTALGLGEFDDSAPAAVKIFFTLLEKSTK